MKVIYPICCGVDVHKTFKVDSAIDAMVLKHESLISLLCTIPGVDRMILTAIFQMMSTGEV